MKMGHLFLVAGVIAALVSGTAHAAEVKCKAPLAEHQVNKEQIMAQLLNHVPQSISYSQAKSEIDYGCHAPQAAETLTLASGNADNTSNASACTQ